MTREWGAVRRYGVAGRVQVTTVKTIHTLSPPLPHHFHCWFFPFWLIIFVESEQQLKKEFHYIFLRQSSVPLSLRPFKKKKKKKLDPSIPSGKLVYFPPFHTFTSRPFLFCSCSSSFWQKLDEIHFFSSIETLRICFFDEQKFHWKSFPRFINSNEYEIKNFF